MKIENEAITVILYKTTKKMAYVSLVLRYVFSDPMQVALDKNVCQMHKYKLMYKCKCLLMTMPQEGTVIKFGYMMSYISFFCFTVKL